MISDFRRSRFSCSFIVKCARLDCFPSFELQFHDQVVFNQKELSCQAFRNLTCIIKDLFLFYNCKGTSVRQLKGVGQSNLHFTLLYIIPCISVASYFKNISLKNKDCRILFFIFHFLLSLTYKQRKYCFWVKFSKWRF